jgi:hypothetical protein
MSSQSHSTSVVVPRITREQLHNKFPGVKIIEERPDGLLVDSDELQAALKKHLPNFDEQRASSSKWMEEAKTILADDYARFEKFLKDYSPLEQGNKFRSVITQQMKGSLTNSLYIRPGLKLKDLGQDLVENFYMYPDLIKGYNATFMESSGHKLEVLNDSKDPSRKIGRVTTPEETIEFPVGDKESMAHHTSDPAL